MAVDLSTYRKENISLESVIQLPLAEETVGLFYTPNQCQFGRWKGGEITDAQDKIIALKDIFEARLFHETAEMRWLREPNTDELGTAVYLFDTQPSFKGEGWQKEILSELTKGENQYLLWGEYWNTQQELAAGWSCLATARIGELFIPEPNLQKRNQRVVLKTLEYFGLPYDAEGNLTLHGEQGNQVVVEERWLNLETYDVSCK